MANLIISPVQPPAPTIYTNQEVYSKMSAIITDVWVVACTVTPQSRVHHWVVFLQISEEESIKVDMAPVSNENGVLQFTYKGYDVTDRAAFRVKYPTINNPTVQQIYNLLTTPDQKNIRMDRYRFSPQGNGCAFWTFTFISKMESMGYLAPDTANQVWGYMQHFYVGNVSQGPPQVQGERNGTFY